MQTYHESDVSHYRHHKKKHLRRHLQLLRQRLLFFRFPCWDVWQLSVRHLESWMAALQMYPLTPHNPMCRRTICAVVEMDKKRESKSLTCHNHTINNTRLKRNLQYRTNRIRSRPNSTTNFPNPRLRLEALRQNQTYQWFCCHWLSPLSLWDACKRHVFQIDLFSTQ